MANHPEPRDVQRLLSQIVLPALASMLLGIASLLPWLRDPLGTPFSAWQLPLDTGWHFSHGLFTYGQLCCCCALLVFWIPLQAWQALYGPKRVRTQQKIADYLPLYYLFAISLSFLLFFFFMLQYLYIDMGSVAQLMSHELQAQLIKENLGYGSAPQLLPIPAMAFDPLTQRVRIALLFDQIGSGGFIPLLAAGLLFIAQWHSPPLLQVSLPSKQRVLIWGGANLLLVWLWLGPAPAAMVCNYQAQRLLAQGDYRQALHWLDRAQKFNPSLDQLSSYHIERGQAWYFFHPVQLTVESQLYLAAMYRQQHNFLASYQELLAARQQAPRTAWVLDEFEKTLAYLAEVAHPLHGAPRLRIRGEEASLSWLSQLSQADPQSVYAHYMLGRIQYDLEAYSQCEVQMRAVLRFSQENSIASSAYTYLALSRFGQHDLAAGRQYLFQAEALDPAYRNNTAREELSGLR